jgi:hypothetical protein
MVPAMNEPEVRLWANAVRLAIVAFGFGTLAWRRRKRRHLEVAAQSWPSVDGWIQCGQVTPVPNPPRYVVTLTYSYQADEYGSGTFAREFSTESDADTFVRQLKDKPIPIRYNPDNPDESVLEEADVDAKCSLSPA